MWTLAVLSFLEEHKAFSHPNQKNKAGGIALSFDLKSVSLSLSLYMCVNVEIHAFHTE